MNPAGKTPAGTRRAPASQAAHPHPNPAGATGEQAVADRRGGAPTGTRNATQPPRPDPTLRATDSHRPARTDARPAPAHLRIVSNPPKLPQRGKPNPNATRWTQAAARLLALGRRLRAANPNPRTRLALRRRTATAGLRILNDPPQPTQPETGT